MKKQIVFNSTWMQAFVIQVLLGCAYFVWWYPVLALVVIGANVFVAWQTCAVDMTPKVGKTVRA